MKELREPYWLSREAAQELVAEISTPPEEINMRDLMLKAWNAKLKREAEEEEASRFQLHAESAIKKQFDEARKMVRLYDEAAGFRDPSLEEWGQIIQERLGYW